MSCYSNNFYPNPAEVPAIELTQLALPDLDRLDDWSYPAQGKAVPDPVIPKPEPYSPYLLDLEGNGYWHHQQAPFMASYQPNQHIPMPSLSQPPTPAAECQVSSSLSPVTSPFSPGSDDTSFEDGFDGNNFGGDFNSELSDLSDLNIKGLTEGQLVSLSARDLNRMCRDMPEDVVKQLKKRRRTLKNRGYAYNSRVRRVTQKNQLERERDELKKQLSQLAEKCRALEKEADQWKKRYENLERNR